ncbi:MAG: RnfABCDGE type electron transport complex subunit D [Steroidobacteraceae bacterium]
MNVRFRVAGAPHVFGGYSVPRVMMQVLAALVPVAAVQVALYGPGLLLQLAVAVPTALGCEALAMRLRRRDAAPALRDGSVLVTAALVALSVTPFAPWWLTAAGTAIAVLIGKHAYGGLGHNPFNPAMVGYAAMLVSFPLAMSRWPVPVDAGGAWSALAGQAWAAFSGTASPARFDAWTGATTLDALRSGLAQRYTMEEITAGAAFGPLAGAGSQWVNLAALAGGAFLLVRGIVRWHIPAAMLAGLALPAAVMHGLDPGTYPGPLFECCSGAAMLGAFFIATDPVTAAASDRGRLVYGAGIGFLTWAIRHWGSYPDGVAFAVLTMNLAAPLIDRWTIPRIHGDRR